jgi:hypothetical protein
MSGPFRLLQPGSWLPDLRGLSALPRCLERHCLLSVRSVVLTAASCVLATREIRDSKTSGIFGYASIGIKDAPEIMTVAENDVADVAIVRV